MFSILDLPQFTTLERAREAVRFGGINMDEIVQYLQSGKDTDRLAQADYYRKRTRLGSLADLKVPFWLLIAALIAHALTALWFIF